MEIFLVIIVLFYVASVSNRVSKVEKILQAQREAYPQAPATKTPSQTTPLPSGSLPSPLTIAMHPTTHTSAIAGVSGVAPHTEIPEALKVPIEPTLGDRFFLWLKEDWLLKVGSLFLLLGFGWLVRYAFLNDWIGPVGRITFGLCSGVLILLLGWWRIHAYRYQGSIFTALGVGVIILTTYAARTLYDFFTPATAIGIMFLSVVFATAIAISFRVQFLALLNLIIAGIIPFLSGSEPSVLFLFSYLLVIIIGSIWVAFLSGWREMTFASLIIAIMYSFPYFGSSDQELVLFFSYIFSGVLFLASIVGMVKNRAEKSFTPEIFTACGIGLYLLWAIVAVAPREWQSLIISLWMVAFLIAAFTAYRLTGKPAPFYAYAGIGVAYLAAATAAELHSTTALTIAYTLESVVVAVVTQILIGNAKLTEKLSFLLLGPIILSFGSFLAPEWRTQVFHEHFFVLLVIAISLLWIGPFILRAFTSKGEPSSGVGEGWIVAGAYYIFALIWLSLHAAFPEFATTLSLFIYTVIGISTYFYGKLSEKKGIQNFGRVLLALVIIRLLVIDVWTMELFWRIITFFAVGTLLTATAFIGKGEKTVLPITPQ